MRSQTNTKETERIESNFRLLNIGELRKCLGGIGTTKVYELVNSGQLSPVRIGRRTFFRQNDVEAFIAGLGESGS